MRITWVQNTLWINKIPNKSWFTLTFLLRVGRGSTFDTIFRAVIIKFACLRLIVKTIKLFTFITNSLIWISSQTIWQINREFTAFVLSIRYTFYKISIFTRFTKTSTILTIHTVAICTYSFTFCPGHIINLVTWLTIPAFQTFIALSDSCTISNGWCHTCSSWII